MTPTPGRVVVVAATGDRPLAARLLAAAAETPAGVVVLSRPATAASPRPADPPAPPEDRLRRLVTGPYRIGAVVPAGRPGGHAEPAERGAHDVATGEAEAAGAVAVSTVIVTRAALDPALDDHHAVVRELLRTVDAAALRTVAEPSWLDPSAGAAPALQAERSDGIRLLFVTAPLAAERLRMDDRASAALLRSLARMAGPSLVTVMATERLPRDQRRRWTEAGLDVVEGPAAWGDGLGADRTLYSHVIVTAAALRSSVRDWLDRTQPQAGRVVFFPSLESRDATRVAPIVPAAELDGLEGVRLATEDVLARAARWAHALWCQWPADAALLRAWAPGRPVEEIPPALSVDPAAPGAEDRSGVLIVAGEGHDVLGGHEDAALRALRAVQGQTRRRQPAASWTVVTDRPTPMLEAACAELDAEIRPEADLDRVMRTARVLLCAHGYGHGQPAVLMSAVEAGLPFVCTPWAAGDLDLDGPAATAVCSDDADLATRTWQLLADPRRWEAARAESDQLATRRYPADGHDAALGRALAALGVDTVEQAPDWPAPAGPPEPPRPFRNPRLPIRPPGCPPPGPLPAFVPKEERERYRLWCSRRGPSPAVLDVLRSELDRLDYRPRLSIVMPVFNTDPDALLNAVASVRAQIYEDWQLCIANDGTDRPETLEVLAGLRPDPKIVVVDLEVTSGEAEATNAALAVASGEYVTFLDHDDELKPHALAQVVRWLDAEPSTDILYTDEDKLDSRGQLYDPHLKPEWSPDKLTAQNYLCHLVVARRSLVEEAGGLRSRFDGSQDYDLVLRLTERTDRIAHIPEPLYSWRATPGSAALSIDAKPYALRAARRAVAAALERRGYGGRVDTTSRLGILRARYPVPGSPKVSVIIPTRNGRSLLEHCIGSVVENTTYKNYEIVIIDNHSTDGPTLEYLATGPWRVIRYPHPFNYARMMNLAARSVECDALLFLNNDTEVITPEWMENLLEHAMRPEIGAVGCRLYFGDGKPQHEGIMTGIGGWAHSANHKGYWNRGDMIRNVTAVTGACTMMRPSVYWRVGGNDERLRVAYNDVDLCLRLHQAGYEVVYTPYAELFHYESSSRGRFEHEGEGPLYGERWRIKENVDAYYSPMFEDFPPFLITL